MSVASLTWADTASSSNTDYEIMTFDEPLALASSAEKSPVSAYVNGVWTDLYYTDGSGVYVDIPAGATRIAWGSSSDSLGDYRILKVQVESSDLTRFGDMIVRLVSGSNEITFHDNFFAHDGNDGYFYFSAWSPSKSVIHFMVSSGSKFRIRLTSNYPSMNPSVTCGGIYSSSDKPFNISSALVGSHTIFPYGYTYTIGPYYNYKFPSGGVLKKGYEYTFNFFVGDCTLPAIMRLDSDSSSVLAYGAKKGNYTTFIFTPSRDIRSDELLFFLDKSSASNTVYPFYYSSSSSSYIPASDTGQQGQVTAANTTIIKNVVTNISNTVSNISNQITNTTNTITNTITNTTNQIKEAVNQSATQISQTVTNTSNQIKDSVNQSAEKISQTVTNKVNEVNGTINSVGKETQKKIDDMQKAVVDKLEDTKKGIITGIIDGLKSLFIPSDDFFKTWFDDMYSFFDERLGFLMLPVDLLVNLIDIVVSADSSNAGIPFPEIQWEGTILIPAQTVKIEIFNTEFGKDLQDKLYFVGNVIMIGALLSLMYRKFEEVLRS